jgi:hypothetical protein
MGPLLGPFRIRNLRPAPSSLPHLVAGPARLSSYTDAVVCVDGNVYEDSIRKAPETKLKYIDSDKDVVTVRLFPYTRCRKVANDSQVGSKDELADRLEEPIRSSTRSKRKQEKASVPLRPASRDMHVFEIDHMEAAIRFWRSIAAQTLQPQFGLPQPVEPPLHASPVTESTSLYPSLEEKRSTYFSNTQPPQLHERVLLPMPDPAQEGHLFKAVHPAPDQQNDSVTNVLTSEGIKQAQQAGEQLRARLTHANPYPQRNRVDRTKAVNSWATYSKAVAPMQTWPHSADQPQPGSATPPSLRTIPLEHVAIPHLPNETMVSIAPVGQDSSERAPPPSSGQIVATNQAPATLPGSLHPDFFENVQASLDKLSPVLDEARNTTVSEHAQGEMPEQFDPLAANKDSSKALDSGETDTEPAEALEITLAKMVFRTIREMSKTLESMNTQFDTLLTPKLVEERLKSKDKLLPAHRQDTVRDMFALRRSIETFALEVAETKQTLARLDESSVFPEGTNLMDFNSMTSAAYSFGRLVRSMDDMIITARRGMLAAKIGDGNPKYHTPRRLARLGYKDVWSIKIMPIPFYYSTTNVHNLVDEIRSEASLGPLDVRQISFHDGPERSVEIEIQGRARAVETWSCLLSAPDRSIRLPLSERQLILTRKHYPDVLRCPGIRERKPEQVAVSAPPPPSRADIDVARLKALQDRRAAWRREFKARTQSVRFREPIQTTPGRQDAGETRTTVKPAESRLNPVPRSTFMSAPPTKKTMASVGPVAQIETQQKANERSSKQASASFDSARSQQSMRRARSVTFGSTASSDARPDLPEPIVGPGTEFHRLRYPPGPFAPPPPQRLTHRRSETLLNGLPYDPTKDVRHSVPGKVDSKPAKDHSQVPSHQPVSHSFVPAFPPLPPLEPLIPQRRQPIALAPKPEAASCSSTTLPGAWPEAEVLQNESSGAFVRRMMGRSPAPSHSISPISSPTLPATQPLGDMQRPVSPISLSSRNDERAARQGSDGSHGLRRHASAGISRQSGAEPSTGAPSLPRPHSVTFGPVIHAGAFDRNGIFQHPSRNHENRRPTPPVSHSLSMPLPSSLALPLIGRPASSTEVATGSAPAPASSSGPEHGIRVQECVDQLKTLGYGDVHNGGIGRLLMYAQITNGDLEDTIDMIEEEREAWQARRASAGDSTVEDGVRDI